MGNTLTRTNMDMYWMHKGTCQIVATLALGSRPTKAKGLQGCGPRESPGVTPYTPGSVGKCRNPSFGLATKAKGLQRCGPRESSGVTSHTHGSVEKCEGVNPHTPKATLTLGDGPPVDSRNFRERFQGSNSMACEVLYIIGKLLELRCLKWAHIAHLDI